MGHPPKSRQTRTPGYNASVATSQALSRPQRIGSSYRTSSHTSWATQGVNLEAQHHRHFITNEVGADTAVFDEMGAGTIPEQSTSVMDAYPDSFVEELPDYQSFGEQGHSIQPDPEPFPSYEAHPHEWSQVESNGLQWHEPPNPLAPLWPGYYEYHSVVPAPSYESNTESWSNHFSHLESLSSYPSDPEPWSSYRSESWPQPYNMPSELDDDSEMRSSKRAEFEEPQEMANVAEEGVAKKDNIAKGKQESERKRRRLMEATPSAATYDAEDEHKRHKDTQESSLASSQNAYDANSTPRTKTNARSVPIPKINIVHSDGTSPGIPDSTPILGFDDEEGASGDNEVDTDQHPFRVTGPSCPPDNSRDAEPGPHRGLPEVLHTPHLMPLQHKSLHKWREIRASLPSDWQWDVEYHTIHGSQHGVWTCTPLEPDEPKYYPLTIAEAPVVLPVEYRWPPVSGVTPPPDPRATTPIDCREELPLELVKDLFLTFQGSIGFYVLINDLLQIIVPKDYDTSWASSHLPHKYGGLKVCYIEQTLEPTMLPSATDTSRAVISGSSSGSPGMSRIFRPVSLPAQQPTRHPSLKLNDFIEARPRSNHRRERFSGRVGLRVAREGNSFVTMATHIITEAILARSHRDAMFGRGRDDRCQKLKDDWNDHTEIWAGDKKIGTVDRTFDKEATIYPDGFHHDITLIKPSPPAVVENVSSPVSNLGWLNNKSWTSLRQQTSTVKILADTGSSRSAKSIKGSRPSDVLVVGEGIFLNQKAAAGGSKNLKQHDASVWKDLVSRALLYRVYPDFDPPNGYSGTALYADGVREDGSQGPGIVGFQSFVQRSGHVQNFEMEGPALERRLQLGRVAFYGAFEVPAELKQYEIV